MGPTIAGLIAAELGIGRILVPRDPGTFSAYGMLVTDVHQERSLTRITPLDEATPAALDAIFAEMEDGGARRPDAASDFRANGCRRAGTPACAIAASPTRSACRCRALRGPDDLADLAQRFHDAHQRRYGHMAQAEAVEIVNFQVTAVGLIPKPAMKAFAARQSRKPHRQRRGESISTQAMPAMCRCCVAACCGRARGSTDPPIIEEKTSTIVLYPGQRAEVDEYLNIEVAVPGRVGRDRRFGSSACTRPNISRETNNVGSRKKSSTQPTPPIRPSASMKRTIVVHALPGAQIGEHERPRAAHALGVAFHHARARRRHGARDRSC